MRFRLFWFFASCFSATSSSYRSCSSKIRGRYRAHFRDRTILLTSEWSSKYGIRDKTLSSPAAEEVFGTETARDRKLICRKPLQIGVVCLIMRRKANRSCIQPN